MKFETVQNLLNYTKDIIGKTFKDIDVEGKLNNSLIDNCILQKIIETEFYYYDNSNLAKTNFDKLGIDLKIIGYKRNKNGIISAKERLVLGEINYNDILEEIFDFNKIIFQNKKILIIWYEYNCSKKVQNFKITNYQLYDMSNDELVLKNDFEIIKEKIENGKAHLLSEGDTSFLGASIIGEGKEQKTSQPKSDLLAKPRVFSLKRSYLTGILRSLDFSLVGNQEYKSVEEYVYAQIKPYIGKTQIDIYSEITNQTLIDNIPKNIGKLISDKLIGTDQELPEKNTLFAKINYKIKNIPIDMFYKPIERMPFRTIRLSEFTETWENSEWKTFFEEVTIIVLCYEGTKEIINGYRVLKDVKKISFNSDDIDSFGKTYEMIKSAILNHDINLLPYPNSYDGQCLEVAPKGQKGANAYDTFFDNDKTKVCFMMNKDFIHKKLTENDNSIIEKNNIEDLQDTKNSMEKFNVFQLYDYGISKYTISYLADKRIPPYNIYLNGMNELNDIDLLDGKKRNLCTAVKNMINNLDTKRNIFELMYCGISKSTCENLIDKNVTIKVLKESSIEELKEKYGIGNAMIEKIKACIADIDKVIEESNRNLDTKLILEEIIKVNTIKSPISLFKLKQILLKLDNYIMDNFSNDYMKLQIENKIKISMYGIKYNFLSIKDYIKDNFDERIANIILERFNGKTLESIAQFYGLTRERVRQICKKLRLEEIEDNLIEDRYKDLFEKYDWSKIIFCELFSEPEITFNYLNERYIKGTDSLNNILNDLEISNELKEKYKAINNLVVTSEGEFISNINEFVRKVLIKYGSNEIDIEDLTDIYNEEIEKYPELKLSSISFRNLEGRLVRSDFAIFGSNHKVRYYDFDSLSQESIEQLKELIIMNDGFYTTEYLFRNNKKLMSELDIRNENELHNILKHKIDDSENNVYFLRMPNFLVEYQDRDDFIIDKIREYSPILVNDFIEILYEDYGHKKPTMLSYLTSNFSSYIKNGYFDIETISLKDDDVEVLKNNLKKDIYTIEELKEILKLNGYPESGHILTNKNCDKLGYKLRGSYIVKQEYGGVYGYFDKKIANELIIRIDENLLQIGSIYNAINYYCKQLKLFLVTDNIYITDRKLNELGITKSDLEELIENIRKRYKDQDYFSVYNVYNEFDCSKYDNLGLTEKFIENLIFYLDDIKTLRINNNRLYSFSKKTLNITNFMYDMVNKYSSISLDDLEKEIMKNYQISIPFDKLRNYLHSTDIFYSDILGKIYSDKNNYYEEVYNE